MFDSRQGSFDEVLATVRPASVAAIELVEALGAAARQENRAAAARLTVIGDLYGLRMAERDDISEQWAVDTERAVAYEVGAALTIHDAVAAHQVSVARGLRERLPMVAAVFSAGELTLDIVETLLHRTGLITDPDILAGVDVRLAGAAARLMGLSFGQRCGYVDRVVAHRDPDAVRRRKGPTDKREIWIVDGLDGMSDLRGTMPTAGAHVFDNRLDALAGTVCPADPRTTMQRRVDAIAAMSRGADRLPCLCGEPECPHREAIASPFVVHVITGPEQTLAHTDAALEGRDATTTVDERAETPGTEATAENADDAAGGVGGRVASLIFNGGQVSPEEYTQIAEHATTRPLIHPGDAPPEPRYTPSRSLADYVRARDLGCRFPGCDVPADKCDLDHTIPYRAGGSTQASNLSCKCRGHHLLKTFWGWTDHQQPNGTITWSSPAGATYVTRPGSAVLFPSLCAPTAPVQLRDVTDDRTGDRSAMMPKRKRTRAQDRAARVAAERKANREQRQARRQARRKAFEALHHPPPPSPDDEPPPF